MSDLIYVSVKRWCDAGIRYLHPKSHMDFPAYMPVDYIDPLEWGLRAEDIFKRSDCGRIYTYIAIPRSKKDTIINVLSGYGTPEDGFRYKARKALINLDRVGVLHGIPDLEAQSNNPYKQMPIIYAPKFDASCLFDIRNEKITKLGYIKDEHTVSSGSYTVGGGVTYLTWAAAFTDIANLTGNLTFTQISAVTETAAHTITENLASNTLNITSTLDHKGNPNSGYITTAINNSFYISPEGPGTVNVSKLYIVKSGINQLSLLAAAVTTGFTLNIFNNLHDSKEYAGSWGIFLNDVDIIANIYNNKIWGGRYTGGGGLLIQALSASSIVENNTIYDCTGGVVNTSQAVTYRNNLILDQYTTYACWSGLTNAIGRNNCSFDTTGDDADFTGGGSGNISSITDLNEVQSVTDTDATFLDVRTDATNANDGGVAVSIAGNTAGIEGNVRPRTDGTYSQGASQWASALGGVTALFRYFKHYLRR